VEAESNTSTVALRDVGGDEMGTQCLGVELGHLQPQVFCWKKITDHESQRACRQDELIGVKPPVVK
jgi:hypothetical protein